MFLTSSSPYYDTPKPCFGINKYILNLDSHCFAEKCGSPLRILPQRYGCKKAGWW